MPVFVDIRNTERSRAGQIVVPLVAYGSKKTRINYAIDVDLPTNSDKRYILYFFADGSPHPYIKLSTGPRKALSSRSDSAAAEDAVVVVIGGDPGLLQHLNGITGAVSLSRGRRVASDDGKIWVANTDWLDLPDAWLGWDGVDAVVLGDAGFAGASTEALQALLTWVKLGGTVVVPGGALSPAMAAGAFGELLPMEVTGTTTIPDLGALDAWSDLPIQKQPALIARGSPRSDATLLLGTSRRPLIAVRPAGSGRIIMTAFDFGTAPVRHWDGQVAMWTRLLAQGGADVSLTQGVEDSPERYYSGFSLAQVASYSPEARLPSIWLILGFLAAYLIVLSPVQYAVLKRLDRREMAWIVTPVIVLLFAVGAYTVGYAIRGGQVIVNRLGVIEAELGEQLARGRGYVGIFSPSRANYELLLHESAASGRELSLGSEKLVGAPTVLYGAQPKIANVGMNMWTTRVFCAEFVADLQGGISGQCEYDGKGLKATVKNDTGLSLHHCRIIVGNRAGGRHDLAAGQEHEFRYDEGSAAQIQSPSYEYTSSTPGDKPKSQIEDMAVGTLFAGDIYGSMMLPPGATAGGSESAGPYFVAVSEEPMVPVSLAKENPTVNDCNLIIVRVPVALTPGKSVSVPSWLIPVRLVSRRGSVSLNVERGFQEVRMGPGEAVFEFSVPLGEAGGTANKLEVRLSAGVGWHSGMSMPPPPGPVSSSGPPPPPPPPPPPGPVSSTGPLKSQVLAYNFTTDKWETIKNLQQNPVLPRPEQFMSADGRVLVKIEVQSKRTTFTIPELKAKVEAF